MIVLKPYQNRVLASPRLFMRACSSGKDLPNAFLQVLTANEFPEVPYIPVIAEGLGSARVRQRFCSSSSMAMAVVVRKIMTGPST